MFLFCTEKSLIERIKLLHFRHKRIDHIVWYLFADIAFAHDRLVPSELHRRAPVFHYTGVEIAERDLILMDEVDAVHRFCCPPSDITIWILCKGSDFFFREFFLYAIFIRPRKFKRTSEFFVESKYSEGTRLFIEGLFDFFVEYILNIISGFEEVVAVCSEKR